MGDTPDGSPSDGVKAHACVLCQRRKVKCDRQVPCTGCAKAQVECEYRDPLPPRRRKKKNPEAAMIARIRRYEKALQKAGIDVTSLEADDPQEPSTTRIVSFDTVERLSRSRRLSSTISEQTSESSSRQEPGRLVTKKGRSLYLDNHLWKSVSNELQDAEDFLPEDESEKSTEFQQMQSSEQFNSSFIFGGGKSRQTLTHFHPNTIQIFKLWNTFLDGVNPLTKVVHVPILQQRLLEAASDLGSISPELEALMFSIYSAALMCMQDDEVSKYFEDSRPTLLARYRECAQQALVNAGVLGTSELMVLQAFLLFILSVRLVYSPHILWSLSGISIRIAQRIGLHKDGSRLGLSVFETEMRRRIWWNVVVVDSTIGHMAGCESYVIPLTDTRLPCNVNDSALDPDMKEPPVESSGPTEMIFCLMSYSLGAWLARQANSKTSSFDGFWEFLSSPSITLEQRDKAIDELEHIFETKHIHHCDLSLPLHLVTFAVAKSAVTSTRLRAHHPRQYQEKGQKIPQAERDLLFSLCLKLMKYGDLIFASKKTQKFHWHIDFHFPWDAFIVLLSELRHRTMGEEVAKAWHSIDVLFRRQHKVLKQRRRSPLHLAIANLAVKAWSAHVAESERRQMDPLPQPQIVRVLWKYLHRDMSSDSFPISISDLTSAAPVSIDATANERPSISERIGDNANSNPYSQSVDPLPFTSNLPTSNPTVGEGGNHDMNLDNADAEQAYLLQDSPMDWDQWSALLHEYQDYSTGDFDVLFAPPPA